MWIFDIKEFIELYFFFMSFLTLQVLQKVFQEEEEEVKKKSKFCFLKYLSSVVIIRQSILVSQTFVTIDLSDLDVEKKIPSST